MATQPNPPEDASHDFYAYYRFDPSRDTPDSARNTLLVVGALIAAATFQAGINPPGGVWQDKKTVDGVTTHPGKAILGSRRLRSDEEENAKVFKKRKTLNAAFSEPKMAFPGCVVTPSTVFCLPNSAWRIDSCLEGRAAIKAPTTSKVFLRCRASMSFTYGFSIAAVEPPGAVKSGYIAIAFILPYAVRLSHQMFKKYKKRG
ncbi:hypothetical protein CK203_116469 [Vitis vinifera]|uniref:PGG domain-containing protein n=1 Tax=Vitis vinifera TaxID=29760 RepID=A0A438BNX5_VITVI|nr:hypothetical protein CK203_116469 [Vitis vinifera]